MDNSRETSRSHHKGFSNVPWLDSSLKETLLSGKPWHKVLDKLGAVLADEVKHRLQNPRERQMVFHLLGQRFVQKYFFDYPNQLSLLVSPNLSDKAQQKLEEVTWNWLQEQCTQTAIRLHCQLQTDVDVEGLAPEMLSFVNDTYNIVTAEMEWHLATHETKRKDIDSTEAQATTAWFSSWASLTRKRPKSVESKDLYLTMHRQPVFQLNAKDQNTIHPKLSFPGVNGPDSDILGESLCAILSSDLECLPAVLERLRGKLLPQTLRQFIWIEKLLKSENKMNGPDVRSVEKGVREKFGRRVAHRLAELKLRSATRSPVSGLIENAVVEVYEKTPCMQPFASNELMLLETSKSLNVLYVHNGTFEPYFIYWLFPLQMALKQNLPTGKTFTLLQ
ncbi:uncharacterized protein LOC115096731 [Rhinatrema bivittatum]|uniref:uncharacterized protein LOC115096731 n=1 Tax=Rhinatrema bivittatum TaxID=194408 RepID=UPI0011284E96|nr:uncharacterized protein LOC115096731 [Rhinatrema bivittatum]